MNIPIDLTLPLPGPVEILKLLLVVTFIIHILFVGLMVGGTYWSVLFKILAKRDAFYGRLARETLDTVTVNKSLAVVLGVAPLLLIGLAYTQYWYTANILTVAAFLSIIWLVILAFWFLYIYKYTWETMANRPMLHLSFGVLACVIFSIVPLIFLTNINLMLLPFRWESVNGFTAALLLPNVLPRYLHFLTATFALTGLLAAFYFWYRGRGSDDPFYLRAQRLGLKWALPATLLQGVFGTLLFVTLPDGAYSASLLALIGVSIVVLIGGCFAMIRGLQQTSGGPIVASVVLLGAVAFLMSFQRHVVRENLLREPHRVAERRTTEYNEALAAFIETYVPPEEDAAIAMREPSGEQLFKRYCASCHAWERQLVGPSVIYMAEKYEGKKEEMVAYVLNPVKVNPNLPRMPKPPTSEREIGIIAGYILAEQE